MLCLIEARHVTFSKLFMTFAALFQDLQEWRGRLDRQVKAYRQVQSYQISKEYNFSCLDNAIFDLKHVPRVMFLDRNLGSSEVLSTRKLSNYGQ